jgi:hypothetical protein
MAMEQRYRLVFRGKYIPGFSRDEVTANLAELFRVPPARVEELLASLPAVIKHEVSIEQGNRYLDVLAEAGLLTHLEPVTAPGEEAAPAAAGWDGVERRSGKDRRGNKPDRRGSRRDNAIQPDRRKNRGRRKNDQ